jgi:hypothetical protein
MAFAATLQQFASSAATKLRPGIGEPEDQIRGPFETFLTLVGLDVTGLAVNPIGEAALLVERIRPDYAILLGRNPIPVGFVELKAPGVGADTSRFRGRNKEQWERLSALPNVLYSDGNDWALYRSGEAARRVRLTGDIRDGKLADEGNELEALLSDFLLWEPEPPRNTGQLVRSIAGLTRLLRDEVLEEVGGGGTIDALAADWRALLFPDATDAEFADGYAQAVTFALLLARAEGIDFSARDLSEIARLLGKTHSLMGKALSVLTDQDLIGSLYTSVMTLVRVCGAVDWDRITDRGGEPWLRFYEDFLGAYDNDLRKRSGSYYTPNEVVAAMVRLTDEILRSRLGISDGLVDESVTIVDPAMGTGTFLLEVIRHAARLIANTEGPGAVGPRLRTLAGRLIGFERQVGPFAVAELRSFAEMQTHRCEVPADGMRLYVTDTLGNPGIETTRLSATLEPIARSRREANKVKSTQPVTVVIGNPPYKDKAGGLGGWVESGDSAAAEKSLLADFVPPTEWGIGAHAKSLYNLYVYFWRWALWKTFEAHPEDSRGVIAFITTSAWTDGPGFAAMRAHMRAVADEVWVIDLTPEGHQPPVNTRVFPGVQQPLAITIVVRSGSKPAGSSAVVRRRVVSGLQAEKFAALNDISLDTDWELCADEPRATFRPASGADWKRHALLGDLFPYSSPGVMASRTWPIAPTRELLEQRWQRLSEASPARRAVLLKETRTRTAESTPKVLGGDTVMPSLIADVGVLNTVRYGFRPLDRQWLIADARVLDWPRSDLWHLPTQSQIFLFELHSEAVGVGPGIVVYSGIPDNHAFRGSFGGRTLPLWKAPDVPNLAPGLLDLLGGLLQTAVTAEDFTHYVAAVVAHPSYSERFADELQEPGVRVPLTGDRELWERAVALGCDVVSAWTYGDRGGPAQRCEAPPLVEVAIPDSADGMPAEAHFDSASLTLHVGDGSIAPVRPEVWAYQVTGYRVVQRWLRRRLREPEGKRSSELDDVVATSWTPGMTTELLQLLNAVTRLVELESAQSELLDRVLEGPLVSVADLTDAGVLPVPDAVRRPAPPPGALF